MIWGTSAVIKEAKWFAKDVFRLLYFFFYQYIHAWFPIKKKKCVQIIVS